MLVGESTVLTLAMKLPTFSSDGKPLAAVRSMVSSKRSRTAFRYSSVEIRRNGVGPTCVCMSAVQEAIACGPGPGGGGVTLPPAPPTLPPLPPTTLPPVPGVVPPPPPAHAAAKTRPNRSACE